MTTISDRLFIKNTLLYRSSSDCENLTASQCEDTKKYGKYFSTTLLIPLGMMLEYKSFLDLGIYQLKDDIKMNEGSNGKYDFRNLEFDRYFKKINGAYEMILDVEPSEKAQVSHFDDKCLFIHDFKSGLNLFETSDIYFDEIFLNRGDLQKICIQKIYKPTFKKSLEDLEFFIENNFRNITIEKLVEQNFFN